MVLATALLASLLGPAPETTERWTWHAPPDCPSGAAIRGEVEEHLGVSMSTLPPESWSVVATVTHDDALGYAVALLIETPDGRHDRLLIEPESCEALSSSAALLIALALTQDPDAPKPEPKPKPEPEPEPEPQPEPEAPLEIVAEPEPPPPKTESLIFGLAVAPGFDVGTLRGVTPYGQLSLAWQWRQLRVAVSGQYGANPPFEFRPVTVPIRLTRWSLAGEVGAVPSLGPLEFPLMVGVEAGQLLLTPGALVPDAPQVAWAAVLLTPGVTWAPLRWLALTARAGTTIGLVRPSFTVPGFDPILATARVGIRASLGFEFRVPLVMKTGGGGN